MSKSFRRSDRLGARIAAAFDDAEVVFTRLTDSDLQWWPFAFLRPGSHEPLSSLRVLLLAVLHGLPLGMILIGLDGEARRAAAGHRLPGFLLIVCAVVFATNRFTLAYFWNRRAERLVTQRERLETWKSGG